MERLSAALAGIGSAQGFLRVFVTDDPYKTDPPSPCVGGGAVAGLEGAGEGEGDAVGAAAAAVASAVAPVRARERGREIGSEWVC